MKLCGGRNRCGWLCCDVLFGRLVISYGLSWLSVCVRLVGLCSCR